MCKVAVLRSYIHTQCFTSSSSSSTTSSSTAVPVPSFFHSAMRTYISTSANRPTHNSREMASLRQLRRPRFSGTQASFVPILSRHDHHRHHHSVDTPHASNTPSSSSVSSIVGLRLYVISTCPLCDGMHDKIRNLLNAEQYLDGSPAREWFIDVINIDTDDTMSAMRSRVPLLAMYEHTHTQRERERVCSDAFVVMCTTQKEADSLDTQRVDGGADRARACPAYH